ncbi:phosphorylase family protein [Geomonas azotofigens]|uniref:phosphorylase family protein n=1 Tax=Geomonas azotofigens TaxID=2843196 RepID=UPI001C1084CF|nr:hypothetical protein [Geomonas azotofigens]MBU5611675.1 hypothetical protein [Geomonas azotofigens]
MLRVLIVDDNIDKLADIRSIFSDIDSVQDDNVDIAYDVMSAKVLLSENLYDVAIIDLNLPTRPHETPKPNNGFVLINLIRHSKVVKKPTYVVALTEYAHLIDEYTSKFYNDMVFLLQYVDNDDNWRKQILSYVDYAYEAKIKPTVVGEYNFDLGIITALHDPEFRYLLKLDANWQKRKHVHDSTVYYEGEFVAGQKKLKVVAAAAPQMGMPASTALSLKVIEHYRPRYLAMVGIAAGVKGKCELGDVLITDISWDYGSGKIRRTPSSVTFEPDPKPLTLSPDLKEKFSAVIREKCYVEDIVAGTEEPVAKRPFNVVLGPVASGAAVLEDPELIKEIMLHNRKLIGIEMEIYGLFYAATNCTLPRPLPFAIKSVCDFGDSKKNDKYQKYASYVSSQFLYRFAISEL